MLQIFSKLQQRLTELSANEVASEEALRQQSLIRFRQFVLYASQHSAYYREVIARNGIDLLSCTPEDFPVMNKMDLRRNFDRIITVPGVSQERVADFAHSSNKTTELLDDKYVVIHTSGSGGQFGYVVYTVEEVLLNSMSARRFMTKAGARKAVVGAWDGHWASTSVASVWQMAGLPSQGETRTISCTRQIKDIVAELNSFQPDLLSGYTAEIVLLAEEQRRGHLQIEPANVQVSGERLSTDHRKLLEQTFQCNVVNVYASSECLYMGFQRSDMNSMCLLEDYTIFEVDQRRTCVTPMFNKTLPLIRYEIEDRLIVSDRCRDYPFTHIEEVVGRQDDMLAVMNSQGKIVTLHSISFAASCSKYMLQLQLREHSADYVEVVVAVSQGLDAGALKELELALHELLSGILSLKDIPLEYFQIKLCERILPDSQTGKTRSVVKQHQLENNRYQ